MLASLDAQHTAVCLDTRSISMVAHPQDGIYTQVLIVKLVSNKPRSVAFPSITDRLSPV